MQEQQFMSLFDFLRFNGSNIGNCYNRKFKKAYGFIWKFKN